MTDVNSAAFPNKAIREKCNAARDAFFACLDKNDDNETPCKALRQVFETDCPKIWVS